MQRFKAIKEVPSTIEGWDEFETIPEGTICEAPCWNGISVIEYKGKLVCDVESKLAKEYFEEIL